MTTWVVLASGPSLTKEDVERVRGLKTIVTNTSFRMAPWADILFGFDTYWWQHHIREVNDFFGGELYGAHTACSRFHVKPLDGTCKVFGNSGATAIALASVRGADKIILLGVDCSTKAGSHWHGDHPAHFRNCTSLPKWPKQFHAAGEYAKARGSRVINCSRQTELTCFEKMSLEEALNV